MMKKGLALLLTLCLLLIPGCSSKKENVIKIVDGRVTEQKLVHRMIKMLVEDRTDLTVSIGEEMTAVNAYNEMKKRVYDVYKMCIRDRCEYGDESGADASAESC